MILHDPFKISARLLPALQIGDAWLSCDPASAVFFLDTPDFEYSIDDFHPGASRDLQSWFSAILSFMTAAAESRQFRVRTGFQSENEDLFPPHVIDWIVENNDYFDVMAYAIEEGHQNLIEATDDPDHLQYR